MTGHPSQRACREEFRQRVRAAADRLNALDQDTLVVSHAGMMAFLSVELRRRGFAGSKLRIAKHATAYLSERSEVNLRLRASGTDLTADQSACLGACLETRPVRGPALQAGANPADLCRPRASRGVPEEFPNRLRTPDTEPDAEGLGKRI
jgi:hypothetical protein